MKDYCTFWLDGIPGAKMYWGDCCKEHDEDFDYRAESFNEANDYLWHCIRRKGAKYKIMADVMWCGVSLFGYPFWIAARWRKNNVGSR